MTPKRRRRTKIGPVHVTYALAAHEMGHSLRQIARDLDLGVATVDRLLRHPRNVDAVLLNRLLKHLWLRRALALADLAERVVNRALPG
jgi:predicted nucleic acid-binding protein